jgi:hypothetical protein
LKWSLLLGATTNCSNMPAFPTPHNFKKGKGVCTRPVEERKLPMWKKDLWRQSAELIRLIDPDFAAGEYVVNYSCMEGGKDHYVKKHVDKDDISFQYALALGAYQGAVLRTYAADGETVLGDFDYRYRVCKMDGRLPHELVLNNFTGTRFCVIWFKSYDARKMQPDPIFDTPCFV